MTKCKKNFYESSRPKELCALKLLQLFNDTDGKFHYFLMRDNIVRNIEVLDISFFLSLSTESVRNSNGEISNRLAINPTLRKKMLK